MNITVLIPTIRRINNFEYLQQSLKNNRSVFNSKNIWTGKSLFSERYLFLDPYDYEELKNLLSIYNLIPIYRTVYPELTIFPNQSYDYWVAHLCLDFVNSMEYALKSSSSEYIMWLEDDTYLSPLFLREFRRFRQKNPHFQVVSPYHSWEFQSCFACIVFQRNTLKKFIDLVAQKWCDKVPLDWMFQYCDYRYLNKNYAQTKPKLAL
ncbi:hypothetical protein [Geminocystis sp.]|uniref:hypothetical protein n=1 Tax=Geminocystis sp. TaxID=2664100 RepID=UPI0035945BAF